MQIQAIIQEIVCIIDEDGSDRFDFTKVGCIFPVIVISILYHSEPMTIRNVPHFSWIKLDYESKINSILSIEMEDLIKVFKEEILGGTASLIEGNY